MMRIDKVIERRVREAFAAVIGHDESDLRAHLRVLSERELQVALVYATFVTGYVVSDVFEGAPDDAELTEMAEDAVQGTKDWIDLGGIESVVAFLKAATAGNADFPGVPGEDIAGYAFVIGGYLLSRYRREGQRWYEYLDDIWNAAQAAES